MKEFPVLVSPQLTLFDLILQCNVISVLFVIKTTIIIILISRHWSVFVPLSFGVASVGSCILRAHCVWPC